MVLSKKDKDTYTFRRGGGSHSVEPKVKLLQSAWALILVLVAEGKRRSQFVIQKSTGNTEDDDDYHYPGYEETKYYRNTKSTGQG